jgi:ribonuclease BN (tRNA processing enzyme)
MDARGHCGAGFDGASTAAKSRKSEVGASKVLHRRGNMTGNSIGGTPGSSPSTQTQVVLLGTGHPAPEPDRSGPATAIVVNGTAYLVDFGPGVVRRAAAAHRKGVEALRPANLRLAFLTHLHSDHTAGYPDLILTPWVVGRRQPLEIYGPKGIDHMTSHILEAYREDILVRKNGIEHAHPEGCMVNVHEIQPGVIYKDGNVTVTAFPVKHGEWQQAFGYRFDTPDRTIVISGDTSPTDTVVEHCNGCDVLIHEVYTLAGYVKTPPEFQQVRLIYHTSSKQLAEIATRAKPKLLILYHQSYYFNASTEADLLSEISEHYQGNVVSGHDLDVY